jgi:hypothetical protein
MPQEWLARNEAVFTGPRLQAHQQQDGLATFRVLVDVRGIEQDALHALRVMLVGDVSLRVAEAINARAASAICLQNASEASVRLVRLAEELAIRPPTTPTTPRGTVTAMGQLDFAVVPARTVAQHGLGTARIARVGTASLPWRTGSVSSLGEWPDADLLPLRLALLRFPYTRSASISRARLNRAAETLQRWRFKVASWKDIPSSGPSETIEQMRRVLVTDLDTSAVLTLLHRLEADLHTSSGSKFDTFVEIDQVLGLDLCRDIGKHRG